MKTILLTIFLLFAFNCFSQSVIVEGKKYWLMDSVTLVKIKNTQDENKSFKETISSYEISDSLHIIKERNLSLAIDGKNNIIQIQEQQLSDLEKIPHTVVTQSNYSFWEISGMIIGSLAIGTIIGYEIHK